MPAAPFASLESRLNASVFARLSNVVALVNGIQVAGVFSNGYAAGSVGAFGMATSGPMIELPTVSVPANPEGLQVIAHGQQYTIAEHQPDGSGISRLMLEAA